MLPNERTTRSESVALPREVEALVAAQERTAAKPLVDFLKAEGINVHVVGDADTAFEEALLHRPHIILVDDQLPPAGGIELCQRLKSNARTHFLPTILFLPDDARPPRLRAVSAGADAVFVPSTDGEERRARLWSLLRTHAIYRRQEKEQRSQGSAIQERKRWISSFVHDLQSSTGALRANYEYLAQAARKVDAANPELDECVRDTETVLGQMVRGLRTVLEFERFEAGRASLQEVPVVLGGLVREVVDELAWHARAVGKEIVVVRANDDHEQPVLGDPDHLREAIYNLVAFVLRQARNRRVEVTVWSTSGATRLSVGGDGDIIPVDERETVFEPYARPSKRAPVAHGLGLSLAKVVVEVHGGSIWVDDPPKGKGGSAFIVELKGSAGPSKLRSLE